MYFISGEAISVIHHVSSSRLHLPLKHLFGRWRDEGQEDIEGALTTLLTCPDGFTFGFQILEGLNSFMLHVKFNDHLHVLAHFHFKIATRFER